MINIPKAISQSLCLMVSVVVLISVLYPASLIGRDQNSGSERVIYAVVPYNDSRLSGSVHVESGIFRSYDGGITWHHTGWKNIRGFGVVVLPESGGTEILVAAGNGIHKTTDGGESWRLTTDWMITEILDIALDHTDSDIVYIATAYGPFKSTDRGESWRFIADGMNQRYCSALLIDRDNPSTVYLGGEGGLYRTENGGESWTLHRFPGTGVRTIVQHPIAPDVLFAGTERDGIFRSDDRGKTWQQLNTGILPEPIYTIAFHPLTPQIVYAGGWKSGVYKTTNGGRSWSRRTNGLDHTSVMALAVHPEDPDKVFAGMYRGGIYKSTNGGVSWTHSGLDIADVWGLVIK
jgi:hypothetical protein